MYSFNVIKIRCFSLAEMLNLSGTGCGGLLALAMVAAIRQEAGAAMHLVPVFVVCDNSLLCGDNGADGTCGHPDHRTQDTLLCLLVQDMPWR